MFDSNELAQGIVEWFRTGSGRPFMLELRPTNRCNLRCPSCVARGQPPYSPGEELSAKDYVRIIDEASELGVRYVQIVGGGEPFIMGEGLVGLMRRIKAAGMTGFVTTNGTLFTDSLIRELVDMGWDAILFSVDGPNPEINDFLRGKQGCFEKATSALRAFAHLRAQSGAGAPRLDIGPVLSHYNCRTIIEMVRLGADLGADNVLFQPVSVPENDKGKPFQLTDEDKDILGRDIPLATKLAEQRGIRTNLAQIDSGMIESSSGLPEVIREYASGNAHPWLSIPCFFPWYYLGINPDGTVGPCSIDSEQTYVQNIRDSSLREIWENHQFDSFRKCLAKGTIPEACERCCGTNVMITNTIRDTLRKEGLP